MDDDVSDFLQREREALKAAGVENDFGDFTADDGEIQSTNEKRLSFNSGQMTHHGNDSLNLLEPVAQDNAANQASLLLDHQNKNSSQSAHPLSPLQTDTMKTSFQSPVSTSASLSAKSRAPPPLESEAIREWKMQQEKLIREKDERSAKKHQEILARARQEIDQFYEEYNLKKAKQLARNKETELKFKEISPEGKGTVWEKVLSQIDLKAKTVTAKDKVAGGLLPKDNARLREVLVGMKDAH